MGVKSGITYVISHIYAKIKVDSYDSLSLGKTLILNNIVILIELVFNKEKSDYYYNIFLEKGSCQLPKNNDNKYVLV